MEYLRHVVTSIIPWMYEKGTYYYSELKGPDIPFRDALYDALRTTRDAGLAWIRILIPLVIYIYETLSQLIRPYINSLTYEEKLTIGTTFFAFLTLYVTYKRTEVYRRRTLQWFRCKRLEIAHLYVRFLTDLRQKSRFLALVFPHIQYVVMVYFLTKLEFLKPWMSSSFLFYIVTFAYPLFRSLETILFMRKIKTNEWKKYIISVNRYSKYVFSKLFPTKMAANNPGKMENHSKTSISTLSTPTSTNPLNASETGNILEISTGGASSHDDSQGEGEIGSADTNSVGNRRIANISALSANTTSTTNNNSIDRIYIPGPELSDRLMGDSVVIGNVTSDFIEPTTEENMEYDAIYGSDAVLAHYYTEILKISKYWASLSAFWMFYHIPIANYFLRYVARTFPYVPLAVTMWLQLPYIHGSHVVTSFIALLFTKYKAPSQDQIASLISGSITISNQLLSKAYGKEGYDIRTDLGGNNASNLNLLTTLSTVALSGNDVKHHNTVGNGSSTPMAVNPLAGDTIPPTPSTFGRIFSLFPSLIPQFIRDYITNETRTGGLLLFTSVIFFFTPGFITSYGTLFLGIIRPLYATTVLLRDIDSVVEKNVWCDSILHRVHTDSNIVVAQKKMLMRKRLLALDQQKKARAQAQISNQKKSTQEIPQLQHLHATSTGKTDTISTPTSTFTSSSRRHFLDDSLFEGVNDDLLPANIQNMSFGNNNGNHGENDDVICNNGDDDNIDDHEIDPKNLELSLYVDHSSVFGDAFSYEVNGHELTQLEELYLEEEKKERKRRRIEKKNAKKTILQRLFSFFGFGGKNNGNEDSDDDTDDINDDVDDDIADKIFGTANSASHIDTMHHSPSAMASQLFRASYNFDIRQENTLNSPVLLSAFNSLTTWLLYWTMHTCARFGADTLQYLGIFGSIPLDQHVFLCFLVFLQVPGFKFANTFVNTLSRYCRPHFAKRHVYWAETASKHDKDVIQTMQSIYRSFDSSLREYEKELYQHIMDELKRKNIKHDQYNHAKYDNLDQEMREKVNKHLKIVRTRYISLISARNPSFKMLHQDETTSGSTNTQVIANYSELRTLLKTNVFDSWKLSTDKFPQFYLSDNRVYNFNVGLSNLFGYFDPFMTVLNRNQHYLNPYHVTSVNHQQGRSHAQNALQYITPPVPLAPLLPQSTYKTLLSIPERSLSYKRTIYYLYNPTYWGYNHQRVKIHYQGSTATTVTPSNDKDSQGHRGVILPHSIQDNIDNYKIMYSTNAMYVPSIISLLQSPLSYLWTNFIYKTKLSQFSSAKIVDTKIRPVYGQGQGQGQSVLPNTVQSSPILPNHDMSSIQNILLNHQNDHAQDSTMNIHETFADADSIHDILQYQGENKQGSTTSQVNVDNQTDHHDDHNNDNMTNIDDIIQDVMQGEQYRQCGTQYFADTTNIGVDGDGDGDEEESLHNILQDRHAHHIKEDTMDYDDDSRAEYHNQTAEDDSVAEIIRRQNQIHRRHR